MSEVWLHIMEGILSLGEIAGVFWLLHGVLGERAASRRRAVLLFLGAAVLAALTIYQRIWVMYSRTYLIFCIVYCSLIGILGYQGSRYGKGRMAIVIAAYFESLYFLDIGVYIILARLVPERVLYGEHDIQRNLTVERILLMGISRLVMAVILCFLRKNRRKARYFLRWSRMGCALFPMAEHGVLYFCDIVMTRRYREEGIERGLQVFKALPFLAILILLLVILWRYKSMYRVMSDRNQKYLKKWKESQHHMAERERIYHDTKNHLVAVRRMLEEGSIQEAREYIEKLTLPMIREDSREKLGHPVLDYLVEEKRSEAERAGIAVTEEVEKIPVLSETEALADWCAMLGNLWDNAIEGCRRAEGEGWIRFTVAVKGSGVWIAMSNSCRGGLDVRKLRTEKPEKKGHGIGISSIEYVVEKYDGNIRYSCEENVFEVLITVLMTIES